MFALILLATWRKNRIIRGTAYESIDGAALSTHNYRIWPTERFLEVQQTSQYSRHVNVFVLFLSLFCHAS